MAFVRKHLPDKFYLEGDQRISLRDRIFREIAGDLSVHPEYANAFPVKFIVEKDKVVARKLIKGQTDVITGYGLSRRLPEIEHRGLKCHKDLQNSKYP